MSDRSHKYPRPLTEKEWKLIEWILPEDRKGYRKYRMYLKSLQVIGPGRWGEGDLILGEPGDIPETSAPMERVYANGIIESEEGKITVSVHEYAGGQMEVQIANLHDENVPDTLTIKRKATYSVWSRGENCPFCGKEVREVIVNPLEPAAMLVICRHDRSIWLYDESDGVNHPIPVTNYYNELMLYKRIKDPSVALHSKNLFDMLDDYGDEDLQEAFIRYNKTWRRISIQSKANSRKRNKSTLSDKLISLIKGNQK